MNECLTTEERDVAFVVVRAFAHVCDRLTDRSFMGWTHWPIKSQFMSFINSVIHSSFVLFIHSFRSTSCSHEPLRLHSTGGAYLHSCIHNLQFGRGARVMRAMMSTVDLKIGNDGKIFVAKSNNCSSSEFVCRNGRCLIHRWVCDMDETTARRKCFRMRIQTCAVRAVPCRKYGYNPNRLCWNWKCFI